MADFMRGVHPTPHLRNSTPDKSKKGAESLRELAPTKLIRVSQMHFLHLTHPQRFCLTVKHRHFCLHKGKKRKFRAIKKSNIDFFTRGLS